MYVYILTTINLPKKFYIGLTKNLKQRIKEHNLGKSPHTAKFRPWKLKNAFWFSESRKAYAFEKYLKSGSGRAFCKRHF